MDEPSGTTRAPDPGGHRGLSWTLPPSAGIGTLEREVLRAARNQAPLSVIFLDVDHFKVFNDTYGHEAGDLVLQQLGTCMRECLRGEDVACRFGGEEFLIVLTDTPIETAGARADLLRERFKARTIDVSGVTIPAHSRRLARI